MPNLRVPEIPQMEVKFMKLKHLLTGIIMAAAFTVSSALTVFAAPAKGRFEEVTSQTISGWAYDSDEPDQALNRNQKGNNGRRGFKRTPVCRRIPQESLR